MLSKFQTSLAVTSLTVAASTGEPFEWTMPRIVPQTPEDQDQGLAVEVGDREVTINPMAAAEEDKVADPMVRAVVVAMANKAAMVAGTVVVAVDKEVDPMARAAVVAMVNNSNTKVNKVATPDSFTLSCWFMR
jgi:hypothetical protein